ncbi:hypothetical protein [uncultured Erythrobacter sp.]|uniref:hypothetical protein n=1 Tax=uncultured Erythrobacter sp. TaxID=263913 RepID=UPI002611B6AF|nr:hypothetical protein [uncultured Erythrobacter sp.]
MLELLASEYRTYAQDIVVIAVCGAALLWGGAPERIIAASWLIFFELTGLIYKNFIRSEGYQLQGVDAFLATTDFLVLVIWVIVALYANRNYPLWIAGMQLLAMTAHLARGMSEAISPIAYLFLIVAPGWFQLIFLAAGVSRHVMRKRKYGEYRSWRYVRNAVKLDLPGERKKSWSALLSKRKVVAQDEAR